MRHPPFLFFWAARTASATAWQIQAVAVGWQMYALTGEAFDLGLVGLAEFFPLIAFLALVGPVADRFDRRRVIQFAQAVEALAAAALAYGAATGSVSKEFILLTVFMLGTGRAFEAPTLSAVLPAVVPAALFPRAVAASASATQIATIGGPAIGGLLYAVSPTLVYAVCAAAWFLGLVLFGFIRIQTRQRAREPISVATVFAGFRYIRGNRVILGAMSLDMFAVLLGGAVALLPVYASDIFHTGPWGLGLLRAAPAAGALCAISVLTRGGLQWPIGRLLFGAVAAFGVSTLVFAVSTSLAVALVALAAMGASDSTAVVVRQTLIQLETTDEMRGRVSAVNSLFIGTSNALGAFESGVTAAWFGTVPAVLLGGFGTLAVVAVWMRAFPQLLGLRSYPPQRVSEEAADAAARETAQSG